MYKITTKDTKTRYDHNERIRFAKHYSLEKNYKSIHTREH